jgi:Ca-activated chloride channel family protein
MTDEPNYYEVLGVEPRATFDTIRAAFVALLTDFPKDVDPDNNPAYGKIMQAYKVLSNPKRRTVYDSLLSETVPYALKVQVESSRARLEPSSAPQLVYLLIRVITPEQAASVEHPLNLCLVIDRSTSMRGARLDRVVSAVELILDRLGPADVLSVISFSDRATVVQPAGHIEGNHIVSSRLRSIEAAGGTEIYQGLSAGIEEMQKVPLSKHMNHLILLTDGHTYGDAEECLALAREVAAKGITFSGMGIGTLSNRRRT